jgi:hypothetical protein
MHNRINDLRASHHGPTIITRVFGLNLTAKLSSNGGNKARYEAARRSFIARG